MPNLGRIQSITFLSLIILLTCSCSRNRSQSFSGQIVEGCDDKTPIADAEVELKFSQKPGDGSITGRSFKYQTTTDATGHFELIFKEKKWSTDNANLGAGLYVDDKLVLCGIGLSDSELGEILFNFSTEISLHTRITTSGLNPDDIVYVNQKMIGKGNLTAVTDTFAVLLVSRDSESAPFVDRPRRAYLKWRVQTSDTSYQSGIDYLAVDDDCQDEGYLDLIISP